MKKYSLALIALLIAGPLLGAPAASASPSFCIAYDTGGPGDRSYNDAAFAGLKKSQESSAISVESVVTDGTNLDRDMRLRGLVAKGCKVIVAIGGGYAPTLGEVAREFPEIQFAIVNDQSIDSFNVASIVFDEVQGGFLAGVVAALSTKSAKVGMITTTSKIGNYEDGFVAGVKATKKGVKTFIKVISSDSAIPARALMKSGVDVIYIATSGSANLIFDAVVKQNVAKQRGANSPEVGVIMLEPDLFLNLTSSTSKYLLASVVKRVDKAIINLAAKSLSNTPLLEVLDAKNGIYGHKYGITDQGIQIVIKSKALLPQTKTINSIVSQAYER
jgi:basic membrane protein A